MVEVEVERKKKRAAAGSDAERKKKETPLCAIPGLYSLLFFAPELSRDQMGTHRGL